MIEKKSGAGAIFALGLIVLVICISIANIYAVNTDIKITAGVFTNVSNYSADVHFRNNSDSSDCFDSYDMPAPDIPVNNIGFYSNLAGVYNDMEVGHKDPQCASPNPTRLAIDSWPGSNRGTDDYSFYIALNNSNVLSQGDQTGCINISWIKSSSYDLQIWQCTDAACQDIGNSALTNGQLIPSNCYAAHPGGLPVSSSSAGNSGSISPSSSGIIIKDVEDSCPLANSDGLKCLSNGKNGICSNKICVPDCSEVSSCTSWSTCSNGKQTRTCTYPANCNNIDGKPAEIQNCSEKSLYSTGSLYNTGYGDNLGNVVVTYSWSSAYRDLDTATTVFGQTYGWNCGGSGSGGSIYSGDSTEYGGYEYLVINLDSAKASGTWDGVNPFIVKMQAGWYDGWGTIPTAPATMTIQCPKSTSSFTIPYVYTTGNLGNQHVCAKTTDIGSLTVNPDGSCNMPVSSIPSQVYIKAKLVSSGSSPMSYALTSKYGVSPVPGGGSSSSTTTIKSSGFWTTTVDAGSLTASTNSDSYTADLAAKELVSLNVADEPHVVGVVSVSSDSAVLTIASTPINITFKIGDGKNFELNNDGYYDLFVRLNSIVNNRVNITIRAVHELVSPSSENPQTVNNNQNSNQNTNQNNNQNSLNNILIKTQPIFGMNLPIWVLIFVMIIVVIAIMIIVILLVNVARKKKKITEKRYRK